MKIVVTGGAGFLGYHIAQKINRIADFKDCVFFDIAPFVREDYNPDISCIYGDVRVKEQMDEILKDAQVVIHCAAALPLWKKKDIFETNIDGTRIVLESSLKNKVNRFIHISSTAVYGVPDVHPLYETHPRHGVGPYGESKVKAEEI